MNDDDLLIGIIDVDNITPEKMIDIELFKNLFAISSSTLRTNILEKLRIKAKDFKIARNFNNMYKQFAQEFVESIKHNESNEVSFTDTPLKGLKCGKWQATDLGVNRIEINKVTFESKTIQACCLPILPVKRLINLDTGTEKVELAFYKDGKWNYIIVEKESISNVNSIIKLSSRGIEVNAINAKELISYLADVISLNMSTIPVANSVDHLGWIENDFAPYTEDLEYDGDISYKSTFDAMKENGSYQKWKSHIIECLNFSLVFRLYLMSSFASALISRLNCNCFCIHLWGGTGAGKTVALISAMSVWGNPQNGKLTSTLNGTANYISRKSVFLKDVPFAGDELQVLKERCNLDQTIMQLTEGMERGTASQYGGINMQRGWNCAFLFTGEEPITKDNSGGGVKNRIIEIETTEKVIADGNYTTNIFKENYGFAGKEFVNLIKEMDLQDDFATIKKSILNAKKTTEKQAQSMALILLADKIVSENILHIDALNLDDVLRFLFTADEVDVSSRAYNWTINWISRNINRFKEQDNLGEIWGKVENNIATINATVYADELQKQGFDFKAVTRNMSKKNLIIKNSQGRNTHNTTVAGVTGRYIRLILPLQDKNEQIEAEMPF